MSDKIAVCFTGEIVLKKGKQSFHRKIYNIF